MLVDPETMDYFQWKIPDGSRVRLTLLQEDDLKERSEIKPKKT